MISNNDAVWAADHFIQYFSHMTSIEDYLRFVKKESIQKTNSIVSLEDEFFNEDVHPEDMNFDIRFVGNRFQGGLPQEYYTNLLKIVSSLNNEANIPGRELRWIVFEKNSKKIVGFIRFGSPIINSKPRNNWLGEPPNLPIFNRHSAMGFVIVPSQPFGYNYLGGKLLALICCSHFARESLNDVFEKDIALFETTSLYGSTKNSSQYDGLEPFLRYKGLTESKFIPLLHDEIFHKLHDRFTYLNNNTPLTDNKASSKKIKRQTRMIKIIRESLQDEEKLKEFNRIIDLAFDLTQKKRFYISDYGYSNVREVILGQQNKLIKGQNWDKFYLENIIQKWKTKASKRYKKLKEENKFRNKVELWTNDEKIQIIR